MDLKTNLSSVIYSQRQLSSGQTTERRSAKLEEALVGIRAQHSRANLSELALMRFLVDRTTQAASKIASGCEMRLSGNLPFGIVAHSEISTTSDRKHQWPGSQTTNGHLST